MGLVYGQSTTPRPAAASCRAAFRLHNTHAAARAGRGCVRGRQQRRAEAAQARRHAGVHVRDAASRRRVTAVRRGDPAAAGELRRLRPRAASATSTRPSPNSRHGAACVVPHSSERENVHARCRPDACASLRSWVASAPDHPDFPIQNLPFGVFSPLAGAPRGGVAIGDEILDLRALQRGRAAGRGGAGRVPRLRRTDASTRSSPSAPGRVGRCARR